MYGAIAGVLAIMISVVFRLFSNKEDERTARNLTAIIVDGICAVFFIVAGGVSCGSLVRSLRWC